MLQIRKYENPGFTEISLRGEIDNQGAQDLKIYLESLQQSGEKNILLNFTRVFRVSYSDMQSLTRAFQDFLSVGDVGIYGITDSVEPVIRSAPFFGRMKVFEEKEEAQLAMKK